MRNRVLEIIAAAAGVAFVLYLYADRSGWSISDEPTEQLLPGVEAPAGLISGEPVEPGVAAETLDVPGAASLGPDPASAGHDIEAATMAWESARAALEQVERQQRLARKRIPAQLDYDRLPHLRIEARQKLAHIRPVSLDQASRISGITPADIALLLTYLESGSGT